MDRHAPAPAAQAAAGLRGRISAERREDAARREEQLDRLLTSTANDSDAVMRAALLSAPAATAEEQEETAREVAEVERGLLELQQVFLDMATLVEAHGRVFDDIERHVAAAAGDVGAAEAELGEVQSARPMATGKKMGAGDR
nr:unnamed protein product [Digitaria exilis]